MKLTRIFGICSVIACLAIALGIFFAPRVAVLPGEVDLGTLRKGQKVSRVVCVRNSGRGKLQILSVDTMCECTTAKAEKTELKPGETTKIVVSLDSSTLSGETHRLIAIETNAMMNKMVFVPLSCFVK